ncbi:secreted frizzled-related protein 1-like [Erpetoichthys calabaricus]|uniref:Secreted frizzled-related protein 1 n=1 Tax=Erpetoichthys calabaricus TaxID=27687 RepID=A0A8C4X2D9_ERPCA|nr:secreted frizzled-related protein 1-like [Erpetoichthys calabaricus]
MKGIHCFTSNLLWSCMSSLLVLSFTFLSFSRASEYEYLSWPADFFPASRVYGKRPQCVEIPDDLKLCQGVGYKLMLLPNLLDHETMSEAKQQASSWVPLVHKNCHPGTQVFLCSLFAPVCLERQIYPCRWLCEAVRDGCTPIMQAFGFPWPEMLACDQFPQDDVCIAMNPTNATEKPKVQDSGICPPCDNEMKTEVILDHMCASEFAIKTKIKEVKRENMDRRVVLQKKKKLLKVGPVKKKDLKKLVLYLKNGAECPCQQLENLSNNYLIMGRKAEKQYLITGIHKWDKASKEFKKALKKMKSYKCPAYDAVFK